MKRLIIAGVIGLVLVFGLVLRRSGPVAPAGSKPLLAGERQALAQRVEPADGIAAKIVAGALAQLGTVYDPAYVTLSYPNGDVPPDRGACTDVVIRALRNAGYDLQRSIHEDMKRNFAAYPNKWGASRTDRNIDHRRVPNQMRFFERHGLALTKRVTSDTLGKWQPGDIVCWQFGNGLYHTGIISDSLNEQSIPLVVHNLSICVEQDCLTAWKIIGHYRYPIRNR